MTHFLRVGFLAERAHELKGDALRLKEVLSESDLSQDPVSLSEIQTLVLRLIKGTGEIHAFIRSLPSEPLVWTGEGTTEEVISMLDNLVRRERSRKMHAGLEEKQP